MQNKKELTAIILAGGNSSRMKQDKGLVFLQGKMLIKHVIEKVKEITGTIIIITKNPAYRQFGYPCISDMYNNTGPLGGIYTGLVHSSTEKNLVVGCDTPFLSVYTLKALVENSNKENVLVTEHKGRVEPLCAIYSRNCIKHFHELLKKGQLKMTDALRDMNTVLINFDNQDWITNKEFSNINTPEELNDYNNLQIKP